MKTSVTLLLFFSLLFRNLPAQQVYSEEEQKRLNYVSNLYREQKFSEVIEYCSGILNSGKNSEAFRLRGMAYRATGEYEKAKNDFFEAVQYNKRDGRLYFEKAMVSICLKEFDKAAWDYTEAIRITNEQKPGFLKYNTLMLEERGRARHYLGFYKEAIGDFKMAVGYGSVMAQIHLLSSLFRDSNITELKLFSDSLLRMHLQKKTGLLADSALFNYVNTLNRIAWNIINEESVNTIDGALRHYKPFNLQCFPGFYYDLLAVKAYIAGYSGNDSLSYDLYRKMYTANKNQTDIRQKIDRLKVKLGIDMLPPEINIINPIVEADNIAKLPDNQTRVDIYGKVMDSSGVISLTVNNIPISKIEQDGVFIANLELQNGKNEITIVATDKMENRSEKKFFVELNEKYRGTDEHINIPELVNNTRYHAILIAEKDYQSNDFEDLTKPIVQIQELKDILTNSYEFEDKNIMVLTNAKRMDILDSIETKCKALTPEDNLLIYFAGHGTVRKLGNKIQDGYLIPSDAKKEMWSTYISSNQLIDPLKYSQGRHILFIVDACYSGALFRSSMDDAPSSLKVLYSSKSRKMMSSGNLEKVPDNGYFFQNLTKFLREKTEKYFPADDMYLFIMKNSENYAPQYERIEGAGDSGGRFIFIRRDSAF